MHYELQREQFRKVLPVFREHLKDPLMYAVVEGHRDGRIFVDDSSSPQSALIWTNSECAYVAIGEGDNRLMDALRRLVLEEIIPGGRSSGRHFLSVFPFPNSYASDLETLFADLIPLRTPINTFSFNEKRFYERGGGSHGLPAGFVLRKIDREMLENPENEYLAEEITFYWGTVDNFTTNSSGCCVLEGNEIVSWCYVQAFGHHSQTIDVWTAESHRRRGLATAVGSVFVKQCLSEGWTPFWINDKANVPSRRLAERLGFEYQGDIFLVDIPFYPFDFYTGLASGFFLPRGEHRQAAESYETAFRAQEGTPEDYYNAASAWALAGSEERALAYLQKAIDRGWKGLAELENAEAFSQLHETAGWRELMASLTASS